MTVRRRVLCLALLAVLVAAGVLAYLYLPRSPQLADGKMRFALCQYDSRPGSIQWSIRHALSYAQEAADHGAGFIVLPEYSFCTADDTLNGKAFFYFRKKAAKIQRRLSAFSRRNRCYLLVNIPHEESGKAREGELFPPRKNRSLLFDPSGRIVAKYEKRNIAFLDSFGGVRRGDSEALVDLPFGKVGLMICRDASYGRKYPSYREADIVIVQFAHITDWTSDQERDPAWLTNDMGTSLADFPKVGRRLALSFQRPTALFANKTGFEPDGGFTGGSCAIGADGTILARAGTYADILYMDYALDENGRIRIDEPPVQALRKAVQEPRKE